MSFNIIDDITSYIENFLKMDCDKSTNIAVECMELFKEYCMYKNNIIYAYEVNEEFFTEFLIIWLPENIGILDKDIIDNIFCELNNFCKLCSLNGNEEFIKELEKIPMEILDNFARVLYAKGLVLKFIKSPVVKLKPLIIDLNKYKLAKSNEKEYISVDQGYFRLAEIFTNNSIVLKKLYGTSFYLRIYMDKNIIKHLKKDDIFYLKIRKKSYTKGWSIDNIMACYLPNVMEEIKAISVI